MALPILFSSNEVLTASKLNSVTARIEQVAAVADAAAAAAASGTAGSVNPNALIGLTVTGPLLKSGPANAPVLDVALATASTPGAIAASDKAKLDGVAPGATANAPDATLTNRSNHTGTQVAATISDLAAAIDARIGTLGFDTPQALTYAPVITLNLTKRVFKITLTGDVAFQNPINSAEGKEFKLIVKQGGAGGFKVTFGTSWVTEAVTPAKLSVPPGSVDVYSFYDAGADGIRTLNFSPGLFVNASPPAATPSSAPVQAFSYGGVAQKGAWLETGLAYIFLDTVAKNANADFMNKWLDRSANAGILANAVAAEQGQLFLVDGRIDVYLIKRFTSSIGGSGQSGVVTANGFYLIQTWLPQNSVVTVFSDEAAANTGRFLRWNVSGVAGDGRGDLEFSVGMGTTRASVRSTPGGIATPGGPYTNPTLPLVTVCRHDIAAGMIYLTVNGVTTSAAAPGTFSPGAAGYTVSGKHGADLEREISLYQQLHVYNQLDQTLRDSMSTYFGQAVLPPTPVGPNPTPAGGFLVGFGTHPASTNQVAGSIKPTNFTQLQRDTICTDMYTSWKSRLRTGLGGRFPAFGGGARLNQAVSEGIGYGMLIAVFFAGFDATAKAVFDDIYNVAATHPAWALPETALMEWKVDSTTSAVDGNGITRPGSIPTGDGAFGYSAIDGDLDIAMGLLLADKQWGSAGTINYKAKALLVIDAIKRRGIRNSDGTILGGPNGDISRTSDYMIGHYRAFLRANNDPFWTTVIERCYSLLDRCQTSLSPTSKLIPDFLINTAGAASIADNTGLGDGPGNPNSGFYFYNACRIPMRVGVDYLLSGDVRSRTAGNNLVDFFIAKHAGNPNLITGGYRMDGSEVSPGSSFNPPPFVDTLMPAASAQASQQTYLNALWTRTNLNRSVDYYSTELQILSLIAASGNWWNP